MDMLNAPQQANESQQDFERQQNAAQRQANTSGMPHQALFKVETATSYHTGDDEAEELPEMRMPCRRVTIKEEECKESVPEEPVTLQCNSTNSDEESDADIDTAAGPEFTCTINGKKFHLHMDAPVDNVLFNLGLDALVGPDVVHKSLTPLAASRWNALHCAKLKPILAKAPVLKIQIPGSRVIK
ncbi:hypothetical protein C0992_001950 [Termitomyces sp. T32_za158]|nr:hypothetical protein C0992_001950 [Termitomyces sp. T32_za158]